MTWKRPIPDLPEKGPPPGQGFLHLDLARGQGALTGTTHFRIDIPVVDHVQDGASADGQEEAYAEPQKNVPVQDGAPGAYVAGNACEQKQPSLVALDQLPVVGALFQEKTPTMLCRRNSSFILEAP